VCEFVALGIQQAMRMRNCVSSVACPVLHYFSTSSLKKTRKKA